MNILLAKSDPDLMDEESLALTAAQHGLYPLKATKTLISIYCPHESSPKTAGDVCDVQGVSFTVIEPDTRDPSISRAYIAESNTPGNIQVLNDSIVTFNFEPPFSSKDQHIVTETVIQGRDDETTSEFRSRFKGIVGKPIANNPLWFQTEALTVPGVDYAKVVRVGTATSNHLVGIYAGTRDFKPVSKYIINKLDNHFKSHALIGTVCKCDSITNTDGYEWEIRYSLNGALILNTDILENHFRDHMKTFFKNYNLKMCPGTQPVINIKEIEGYLLTQMYDTTFNIYDIDITCKNEFGTPITKIELNESLVLSVGDKKIPVSKK
jgi:hypothetical protein